MAFGTKVMTGVGLLALMVTWAPDPCGACSCAPPPSERYALALASLQEIPADGDPVAVDAAAEVIGADWSGTCTLSELAFYGGDVAFTCDAETYISLSEVGDVVQ